MNCELFRQYQLLKAHSERKCTKTDLNIRFVACAKFN